jgi:hypothetical protein
VEVADGFYGCEPLVGVKSVPVTFRAAAGAAPWITCRLKADGIAGLTLERIKIAGLVLTNSQDVTLRNVDISCEDQAPFTLYSQGKCSADLHIDGSSTARFTMTGGSIGPTWDDPDSTSPGNSQIGIGGGHNLVFDGVWFHDNRRVTGAHTECLMVVGGDGVVIRNSRFQGCNVFALFVTYWNWISYPEIKNLTVENNIFLPVSGTFAIQFSGWVSKYENLVYRNNTSFQPIQINSPGVNARYTANVGPYAGGCATGVTYSRNVFQDNGGGACGPTDKSVTGPAYEAQNLGLDPTGRPLPGSPAINAGDPTDYPPHDIDGRQRPIGAGPDAGASESG